MLREIEICGRIFLYKNEKGDLYVEHINGEEVSDVDYWMVQQYLARLDGER